MKIRTSRTIKSISLILWGLGLLVLALAGSDTRRVAAEASEPGLIIRTHGVKINVDDMDKALAFYGDKLGFEIENRQGYPREVFLKTGGRIKLSLRAVSKLQSFAPADTRVSLTLQVNDLDEAIARMKARGAEFAEAEKRKEGVGYAISIQDPFGHRISLMHQTIVKVEPFKEPRIYNFGFYIPNMDEGRDFYSKKLGFIEQTTKYLPGDMPLIHQDKGLGYFMLHSRPGVQAVKSAYPEAFPWYTVVFETDNLQAAVAELEKRSVKIPRFSGAQNSRNYLVFADPFGNVSELIEAAVQPQPASPARSQAGPCESQPIYKQFDFWVGEWDVKQMQAEKGASVGASRIEKLTGGCSILENWESPGFSGKSWNFYDVGLGKWRQIWIDGSGRKAEFSGEYREDAMRLDGGAVLADGRKVKSRMTFFNLGPDKVRQFAERSTDGGQTWTTTVDYLYLRKK